MCSQYEFEDQSFYPNQKINIFIEYHNKIAVINSLWGFKDRDHIVFNARSETVNNIPLFKDLKHCIVKADRYFEWDNSGHKVIFQAKDNKPLLMAALVRKNNGKNEHTIITVPPNQSVLGIHDRMPLILEKKDALKWLFHQESNDILVSVPKELNVYRKIKQMELDI